MSKEVYEEHLQSIRIFLQNEQLQIFSSENSERIVLIRQEKIWGAPESSRTNSSSG